MARAAGRIAVAEDRQTSAARPRDSVARRFFRSAFAVFLLFAVVLTGVLIGETLWVARDNLKGELAIYQRSFEKSLSAALWAMDREKLESIVRGIVEIPVIEGVRVLDPATGALIIEAGVFSAADDGEHHPLGHRFDLIHGDGFGREVVARAEFQSSYMQLLRRTQKQVLLIVVLAVLETLAFWAIFLWVGKRLLVRPLTEITEKIGGTDAPERLRLTRATEEAIGGTELGMLRKAYDALAERVHGAQEELARANAALDARVRERTLELQEANRKLEELAHTDALTGLANRREFLAVAATAIARARRSGRPLSLIVGDIDHFKQVNDVHGHIAGDRVICHVATHLFNSIRHIDLVARLGGDEFVVLLPDIGPDEARVVAERMRDVLAAGKVALDDGQAVGVSLSIGLASLEAGDERLEELFQRADRALYAAKTAGRNRVIDHDDLPDAP